MKTPDSFISDGTSAILGLAVGDALGVPAEFMSRTELRKNPVTGMRSGGAHNQPAGTWSDDTSMTLCVMDSLYARGIDYADQMDRFADWLWNAGNTARGEVFDVGGTTRRSIFRYLQGTPPLECGETAEYGCGNGSLMRILPAALYAAAKRGTPALDDWSARIMHDTSSCTHAHPRCQMACGIYAAVVFQLLDSSSALEAAVRTGVTSALEYYRKKPAFAAVFPDFSSLAEIGQWEEPRVRSSGYVLHTLQAALWCLLNTSSYEECACRAVNLGEDADTTAAVAGGLAGLWYGKDAIPPDWLRQTAKSGQIEEKSRRFLESCFAVPSPPQDAGLSHRGE